MRILIVEDRQDNALSLIQVVTVIRKAALNVPKIYIVTEDQYSAELSNWLHCQGVIKKPYVNNEIVEMLLADN